MANFGDKRLTQIANERHKFKPDEYQIEGANWLASRKYALLADMMGVGKSPQAVIAAEQVGAERILVICGAGKRTDWLRDFTRWSKITPSTHRVVHTKFARPLRRGVTVVSYEMCGEVVKHAREDNLPFDVLIVDEVQYLKSPSAKRTHNVLGPKGAAAMAKRVWLLSGTPMLNHPGEMWTWLYTLFPHTILGKDGKPMPYDVYADRYCVIRETRWGPSVVGAKNTEELKERIAPIMLRRDESVLTDLPPLEIGSVPLDIENIATAKFFEEMIRAEADEQVREVIAQMRDISDGKDMTPGDLVYTGRTHTQCPIAYWRRITSMVKAELFVSQLLPQLRDEVLDKVVVFAIHRDALKNMATYLRSARIGCELVWGGTPAGKRDAAMHNFQTKASCRVFLGQIQATGTGVDGLQEVANHVFFLESDWTPAGNYQAIKRLHRRGQKLPVKAGFCFLPKSSDEIVQRVVARKTKILADIFK